jgi:hypothetical protein
MTYRISYSDGSAGALIGESEAETRLIEEYRTEAEALRRARELLEAGEHDAISVRDSSGNVLYGVCLQLRLGFLAE